MIPTRRSLAALPLATMSAGMLACEVSVAPPHVVFVKGLLEASDGLGQVFAERGGALTIVAPAGRGAELAEFLSDLEADLGARAGAVSLHEAAIHGPVVRERGQDGAIG